MPRKPKKPRAQAEIRTMATKLQALAKRFGRVSDEMEAQGIGQIPLEMRTAETRCLGHFVKAADRAEASLQSEIAKRLTKRNG